MATSRENARTSALRADILKTIELGVSKISPTVYCLLNGVPTSNRRIPLTERSMKNVLWARGGKTFDWRVRKYRSTANTSTGPLRVRSFSEKDLHANPSITTYMHDETWGIGEGDLEDNRHAGPQKIIDLKRENLEDAVQAVYAEIAASVWNVNDTNQAGGLSMFSPSAHGASTTYGGIAMDASTTIDGSSYYYWKPTGYDYGSDSIDSNLFEIIGSLKGQMTFSGSAGGHGGQYVTPDCAACDPTLRPYILAYFESNAAYNIDAVSNLNLLEDGDFENWIIGRVVLFCDDNFGGADGYVDASATEEIMMMTSKEFALPTTHTRDEGLISLHSTTKNDMAWLAGQAGVAVTGKQAPVFKNPRSFQVAYT